MSSLYFCSSFCLPFSALSQPAVLAKEAELPTVSTEFFLSTEFFARTKVRSISSLPRPASLKPIGALSVRRAAAA